MECVHCRGPLKRQAAPYSADRKGYHVHWDAIPAWVCAQCGQPYFEPREVEMIERALSTLDEQMASLQPETAA